MRHSDGSTVSGPRNGWPVDVYQHGRKVRQAIIVRQSFTRERLLYDADGRAYAPRPVGLGVVEVEVVES